MKYRAFGLTIESEIELPELMVMEAESCDIEIVHGVVPAHSGEKEKGRGLVRSSHESDTFAWEGVARFEVSAGSRIVVDPSPGVSEELLRQPLLGIVMSDLLRQRGYLVLHASVVSINGHIAAFVGPKRAGKSTIAAALVKRGHELLSDDTLIVDTEGEPIVYPGFARLNLWPEAADALSFGPEETRELYSGISKLGARVGASFSGRPGPLRSIYGLGIGEWEISPLIGPEAFRMLLPHTYQARYFPDAAETASNVFTKLVPLLNKVSVRMLRRPADLTKLGDTAMMIEADMNEVVVVDAASGQ